jgi:hypothetical protein
MKRYQEEETRYLGLDVILSNNPQPKTFAVTAQGAHPKSGRGSHKPASRVSSDDSLSKQRIEEWLDALLPGGLQVPL